MRLGFLASHRGSNMQSIIDACKDGSLPASPVVIISNNAESGALQRAAAEGIAAHHISSTSEGSENSADQAIADTLERHRVDLVVLAGYMKRIGPKTLSNFNNSLSKSNVRRVTRNIVSLSHTCAFRSCHGVAWSLLVSVLISGDGKS